MKSKRKSKIQILRWISLVFFIVLVTVLAVLHQLSVPGAGPIDALCPFGALETVYKFLAGGEFLSKIFASNIILLAGVLVLTILFGRYFCGWICMFGGLQEFFGVLGKKIFRRRFIVPEKIDGILRYGKYIVLVVVLIFTWKLGELVIRPYDPFVAYSHLSTGFASVWSEFAVGLVILCITLVGSLFYDRVFCKYLCPLGGFLGILSKVSPYRIKRVENTCTSCTLCNKACPVNIKVMEKPAITSAECINCLECVTVCPTKKETLYTTIAGIKVKPGMIAVAGLAIYITVLGASMALGYWKSADATLEEKAEAGILTPDDIKGSHSLKEVAEFFNLNIDSLYGRLNITEEIVPATTLLKEIKNFMPENSFEAEEVRIVVKDMLGLQVNVLPVELNNLSSEQEVQVQFKQGEITGTGEEVVNPAPLTEKSDPANDFKTFPLEGTMSVTDVAGALNVTEIEIIRKLELPESIPVDKPLRDLKDEFGFTMPELKERMKK